MARRARDTRTTWAAGGRAGRRIWWATWPAAIGSALVSALLLWPWWVSTVAAQSLLAETTSGVDFRVEQADPAGVWVMTGIAVAVVALPFLVGRWAKKAWLGFLLLGLAISAVVGVVGLGFMGIL